ncbi:hypothetical protein SLS55_006463 [Diplodia seriata]|uniref:Uncharacterized protein n=1 Tax=Diplodia seriata TaxID=420778 RepID=A0ABR3CEA0_9PEZI
MIQQGFLKPLSETKKPSWDDGSEVQYSIQIAHISDLVTGNNMYVDRATVSLRKAMATWQPEDCKPRLWMSETRENMTKWQQRCARDEEYSLGLENLDRLSDPFIAQLPYGFNTGFNQVYAPRINTTVAYEEIATEDAPDGCFATQHDSRFVKYQYDYADPDWWYQHWNISACISSAALTPQIQNTRNRQSFNETFHMHLTRRDENAWYDGVFKVSAQTTIGYFELPNYSNGNLPGPLLETYPESTSSSNTPPPNPNPATTEILEDVPAKGPLTTLFLALFGNGSFPDAMSDPSYLAYLNQTSATTTTRDPSHPAPAPAICQDIVPPFAAQLFPHRRYGGTAGGDDPRAYCLVAADAARTTTTNTQPPPRGDPHNNVRPQTAATTYRGVLDPGAAVRSWLDIFFYSQPSSSSSSSSSSEQAQEQSQAQAQSYRALITTAFTAAAYTANELWLTNPIPDRGGSSDGGSLTVAVDEGVDAAGVVMPLAGAAVGSALLAVFLGALWTVLVRATLRPRWTTAAAAGGGGGTMGAWEVVRLRVGDHQLGGGRADGGEREGEGALFDRLPGFVGDARPEGDVGVLKVGAEGVLRWRRRYEVEL